MTRYYRALTKKLKKQIEQLSDRDYWKERALVAEETVDKLHATSEYNKTESARIGMESLARLSKSSLKTYLCAQCGRDTIHQDQVCIGCGVLTVFEDQEGDAQ